MDYSSDLHTHTIESGHAYTTLLENISYCKENGIKILGTSEHGPAMPNAPHRWYFCNMKVIPRIINDVIILKGCEANILDTYGNIDLTEEDSKFLDYMIASFHEPVFKPTNKKNNTQAFINCVNKNPKVEILGHIGNPAYELDYDLLVKFAKEKDIMIEINNSSVLGKSRAGSDINCKEVAKLCKEYGTKIILTSDSHIAFTIGHFEESIKILESINFPEELIMNEPKKLLTHFKNKEKLLDINL